jgi:hypothetical protein
VSSVTTQRYDVALFPGVWGTNEFVYGRELSDKVCVASPVAGTVWNRVWLGKRKHYSASGAASVCAFSSAHLPRTGFRRALWHTVPYVCGFGRTREYLGGKSCVFCSLPTAFKFFRDPVVTRHCVGLKKVVKS